MFILREGQRGHWWVDDFSWIDFAVKSPTDAATYDAPPLRTGSRSSQTRSTSSSPDVTRASGGRTGWGAQFSTGEKCSVFTRRRHCRGDEYHRGMSRRPTPERIDAACQAATRNRLIGEGVTEATADTWIAAWAGLSAVDGRERDAAYWGGRMGLDRGSTPKPRATVG